ncbi:VOC family protein [Paramagnetospirillum kuznetsovii]|uniref:VOC family protein n=1 Tax=Paramagnetospirillum kuznetsovii TaxID=2053833 RepID=UPI001EFD53BF|nr:VOC family protein [Paramagnetospirillum kuznetsovii]
MPRLDHINVVVSDMARSIDFYTSVLDLRPIMDRELSGDWFERVTGIAGARARCVILDAADGACRVELLQFAQGAAAKTEPPSSGGLRHFALRVHDLNARLAILRDRWGQTVQPVSVPDEIVKGGKRMCYIRDPDGAMVELCEYGAQRPEFC